jgi:ribonuclease P protein component
VSNQFKFKQNEVEILFKNSKYIYKNNFLLIKKSLYNVENPKFLIVFVKNFGIACYRNYLRRCIKDILLKINFYNKKNSYVFIFKKIIGKKICYQDIKTSLLYLDL